jgi:hypothetical protein
LGEGASKASNDPHPRPLPGQERGFWENGMTLPQQDYVEQVVATLLNPSITVAVDAQYPKARTD